MNQATALVAFIVSFFISLILMPCMVALEFVGC
jgi:hypothetical protein